MTEVTHSAEVIAFWNAYLATVGLEPQAAGSTAGTDGYDAWAFGDGAAMADELGALVCAGSKRATASLLWEGREDEEMPRVGQKNVILDGRGQPLCIIETTEVTVTPFVEVDEAFAAAEGEGDGSLRYWREAHRSFFGRACERLGRAFEDDAPVVCMRFRLLYRKPPAA